MSVSMCLGDLPPVPLSAAAAKPARRRDQRLGTALARKGIRRTAQRVIGCLKGLFSNGGPEQPHQAAQPLDLPSGAMDALAGFRLPQCRRK
jgi:hypothetical protein